MHVFIVTNDSEMDDPSNRTWYIVGVYTTQEKAVEIADETFFCMMDENECNVKSADRPDDEIIYSLSDEENGRQVCVFKKEVE